LKNKKRNNNRCRAKVETRECKQATTTKKEELLK